VTLECTNLPKSKELEEISIVKRLKLESATLQSLQSHNVKTQYSVPKRYRRTSKGSTALVSDIEKSGFKVESVHSVSKNLK